MKHYLAALFLPLAALQAQTPGPGASPISSPALPGPSPSAVASPVAETPPGPAASPDLSGTNAPHAQPVQDQELVTRLQIFLDQQNFGPGIIDGRWGEFTGKALVHYARAHHLEVTPAIYDQLPLDTVYPIYADYTITAADLKTVGPVPPNRPRRRR